MKILNIQDLHKSYAAKKVLKGISFHIGSGETLAYLGPNGAGKTTTIKCLLGLTFFNKGTITVQNLKQSETAYKKSIGYVPQEIDFPDSIKVIELIKYVSSHYDNPLTVDEVVAKFSLEPLLPQYATKLSGGQKRSLGVAIALIGQPKLLVLDEPSAGLDINARKQIWQQIKSYCKAGGAVFLTTHYMEEAEELASKIALVHQGKLIKSGDIQEIQKSIGIKTVTFEASDLKNLNWPEKLISKNGTHSLQTLKSDEFVKKLCSTINYNNLNVSPLNLDSAIEEYLKGVQ